MICYPGSPEEPKLIDVVMFADRPSEFDWIARSIAHNITQEKVAPEQIVVICLDQTKMKSFLPEIQRRLFQHNIDSTIPGLNDSTASFAEKGYVTLSTVYRAKGNEAHIVYILNFDALYDYVEAIEHRNRAFTSISRSKAWVRITGISDKIQRAKDEIDRILADQPRFKFPFPDMEKIRRLDAETGKRRRELKTGRDAVSKLMGLNEQAFTSLAEVDPELIDELLRRLEEVKRSENQ